MLAREREKLSRTSRASRTWGGCPGVLFVVDSKKEQIAVSEANKLGIPIVAIVDTNADPDLITVPIAGQRRRDRSVELITAALADAIGEARRRRRCAKRSRNRGRDLQLRPGSEPATAKREAAPAAAPAPAKPEAIAARLKTGAEGEVRRGGRRGGSEADAKRAEEGSA